MARLRVGRQIIVMGCDREIVSADSFPNEDPLEIYALYTTDQGCDTPVPNDVLKFWYKRHFVDEWILYSQNPLSGHKTYVWISAQLHTAFDQYWKVTFGGLTTEFKIGNPPYEPLPPTQLIVSKIGAVQTGQVPYFGYYDVMVQVSTTGSGTFRVTKDGLKIVDQITEGTKIWTYLWGFKPGTYDLCADVI